MNSSSIDFDLRQLEIFCRVYELRSFSKAADAVFLAQASVSERIARLEEMIGAKLFDRLGRTISPTRTGDFLYSHALPLLDMKRRVCAELQEFLGLKKGKIYAGGSTIPGEYILPGLIHRFRKEFPLVSVVITVADSGRIEQDVLEGTLELGVVGAITSDRNLEYHNLWEDELVLAVPRDHPLADKTSVSLQDIREGPFILRETGSGTLKVMADCMGMSVNRLTSYFNVAAVLGSSTAVKEAVKAGLGISILSYRAIETELKAGFVKAVRFSDITMKRNFFLIRDRRRTPSPICQTLFEFLLSRPL